MVYIHNFRSLHTFITALFGGIPIRWCSSTYVKRWL